MRRLVDLALCVAVGLAVIGAIVVWAFFFPQVQMNPNWWMFGWFTAGIWIILLQSYWRVRRTAALWAILILSLLTHTIGYAILFRHVRHWPAIAYLATMPAEGMLIAFVIWRALGVLPRPRIRRPGSTERCDNVP